MCLAQVYNTANILQRTLIDTIFIGAWHPFKFANPILGMGESELTPTPGGHYAQFCHTKQSQAFQKGMYQIVIH